MKSLTRLIRPDTLLGRTALALGLAFLLFGLFSAAVLQFTLVRPHTKQAAEDLASFLVLVAQIWVELPPDTRSDYEKELLQKHELRVLQAEAPEPSVSSSRSYLGYLHAALIDHIRQPVSIHEHPGYKGWVWADFPMGGRMMRLGFKEQRLQSHIFLIVPVLALVGLSVAFALSILLVRRITRPLATMAEATRRIGDGDFSSSIPETGPQEIAHLARKLNLMEQRINHLLENRTTLLAGISHDLRTPLARIRLELVLLRGEENKDLIEGIQHDIEEMDRLISQTLLLARGLGQESRVEVDIDAFILELVDNLNKAGNEIFYQSTQGYKTAVRVSALRRALSNLIENAVNYSGGKTVTLECGRVEGGIAISVIDKGPGIAPAHHETIFQPFYRIDDSRNRNTGGSGLGLAIVRQLCQANGWEIGISSPQSGGTVFRILLPLSSAQA